MLREAKGKSFFSLPPISYAAQVRTHTQARAMVRNRDGARLVQKNTKRRKKEGKKVAGKVEGGRILPALRFREKREGLRSQKFFWARSIRVPPPVQKVGCNPGRKEDGVIYPSPSFPALLTPALEKNCLATRGGK